MFRPQESKIYIHAAGPQYEATQVDEFLEDYDFTLHYHPGKANGVADVLGRKS